MTTTRRPDATSEQPEPQPGDDELADRIAALLAAHVPLSLLLDLGDPAGPHSRDLFAAEAGQADWLLPAPRPSAQG
jgi:hypothetical protein